jgi:hypothetical protein
MHSETNILDFIDYEALPYDFQDYEAFATQFLTTDPKDIFQ